MSAVAVESLVGREGLVGGEQVRVIAQDGDSLACRRLSDGEVVSGCDVVVLPVLGDRVRLTGGAVGVWLELRSVAESSMSVSVWVNGAREEVALELGPVVVLGRMEEESVALLRLLVAERDDHQKTRDQHRAWVDRLVVSAQEWADDNDLCSRFDDFMEAHDLPARQREFCFDVEVATTVSVRRWGRTEDDAWDDVSESDLESLLSSDCFGIRVLDHSVVD